MSFETISVSEAVTVRLLWTCDQAPSWSGGGRVARSLTSMNGSGRPGRTPVSANSSSVRTTSASHGRNRPVAGSSTSGL